MRGTGSRGTLAGMCARAIALVIGAAVAQATPSAPPGAPPGQVVFSPTAGDALTTWARRIATMIRRGELRLKDERSSADGETRDQWYEQRYKGVPVAGTEVWRRLAAGNVVATEGTIYENVAVNPVPKLTRSEAADRIALASGTLGPSLPPELVVLPLAGGGYRLVYQARVFSGTALTVYSIDASTGAVVATATDPDRP